MEQTKGQKVILNLYAAFGVSLILSIIPNIPAAVLSLVFFLGVLVAGYRIRSKAEDKSFAENHATYVIRSLWIAAFFSIITTFISVIYMMNGVDYTLFNPCTEALVNKGTEWLETAGMNEIYPIVQPCIDGFVTTNKTLFVNSAIIAGGPVLLYMAYRMIKGVIRAKDGYRLSDERSWF